MFVEFELNTAAVLPVADAAWVAPQLDLPENLDYTVQNGKGT